MQEEMTHVGKKDICTGHETPVSANGFVKSSAYAPVSLNMMGMYLIKEHMNAHYRRIYNVKASVNTNPPHSLQGTRARSAGASRTNSRISCPQDVANKPNALNQEWSDDPKGNMQLMDKIDRYLESVQKEKPKISARNKLKTTTMQRRIRQSPDLLEKHKDYFTKPSDSFMPRTLVRNSQSRLLGSRTYHPPVQRSRSQSSQNDTSDNDLLRSGEERVVPALKIKRDSDHKRWLEEQARKERAERKLHELDSVLQGESDENKNQERRWLDDQDASEGEREVIAINHRHDVITSSVRPAEKSPEILNIPEHDVTPDHANWKPSLEIARKSESSFSKRDVTSRSFVKQQIEAEEEELKYLEFITDVTNDILLRGVYTDRALKQVFQYHMNKRNDLDFNKMKNLLGKLQDDLGISRFENRFGNNFDFPQMQQELDTYSPTNQIHETVGSSHWEKKDFGKGLKTQEPLQQNFSKTKDSVRNFLNTVDPVHQSALKEPEPEPLPQNSFQAQDSLPEKYLKSEELVLENFTEKFSKAPEPLPRQKSLLDSSALMSEYDENKTESLYSPKSEKTETISEEPSVEAINAQESLSEDIYNDEIMESDVSQKSESVNLSQSLESKSKEIDNKKILRDSDGGTNGDADKSGTGSDENDDTDKEVASLMDEYSDEEFYSNSATEYD